MLIVSNEILDNFNAVMAQKQIPANQRQDYRKWFRYFLDFRAKYSPPDQGLNRFGCAWKS